MRTADPGLADASVDTESGPRVASGGRVRIAEIPGFVGNS